MQRTPRRDQVPEARRRPNPEEAAAVTGTLPQPTLPPPLRVRTPASGRGRGGSDHGRSRASAAQIRTCRAPPGATGCTALFKANSPEFTGLKSAQTGRGPVVGAPRKRFSGLRGHREAERRTLGRGWLFFRRRCSLEVSPRRRLLQAVL
ncbi:uncharacterized protein [Symphalangus syndactylus]|uniref:uncharacterized protein n=1 Tax=Symphalangus syndactylus TaxID=9590 RepID=UPI003007F1E1